ncbi:uncharacterized protein Z518_03141 [Rhinocladiella mackenziei CBS 650.93]|uniref:Uncharacterized protein n=1 Tax=Rhinocladiella mackenziei CBS 650.93 TaxID=1442369 RepID=A0A0D2JGP5_9EURO|nr:uncharacterized protein Z518_03141 [Rhinocladiella mackenziei CBS 650.93]KIX08485.1 hypothetical protein Z518_03141 [Rhinocladiella mackenziei CBS 650.93]
MGEPTHKLDGQSLISTNLSTLASDLDSLSLSRFDDLVSRGELIYEPSTAETAEDQGFKFEFRLVPHLRRKPITPSDAPERKTGQGSNPFLNPDPNFVISSVGSSHLLILNKYSVYRPSLLLITRYFAPQTDGLDRSNLAAAWAVLQGYKQRYMMVYNCGFESGSSQGHKHMQLWLYPDEQELGFELFPNKAESEINVTSGIPKVPHRHFVLRLPPNTDEDILVQAYSKLLKEVQRSHREADGGTAYNVILVKEWMCLIPRRHSGLEKGAGANAAAVLGLVWVSSKATKDVWTSIGPAEYFKYLGIPE